MEIKVLSKKDIMSLLKMHDVIEEVQNVYSLKAKKQTVVWPLIAHHFNDQNAVMDIKSGYVEDVELHGLKILNNFPYNAKENLSTFTGLILVFDSKNGMPKGILDASYVTGMRTGASAVIGAKYLSRKDSKNLLLIGAGKQSAFQVAAVVSGLPDIRNVYITDPLNYENAMRFSKEIPEILQSEFGLDNSSDIEFIAEKSLSKGLELADIVFTITPSRTPIVKKEWVKPGTHFSCIGADMVGKQELESNIISLANIFVDDLNQCKNVGEIEIPFKEGAITESNVRGEIGDLINGIVDGRRTDDEITIFDATGTALLDIVTANIALNESKKSEIGTEVMI